MAIQKIDVCRGCGKPKSPDTFGSYVAVAGPDAGKRVLRAKCHDCIAAYKRQRYAQNPEKYRAEGAADYRRRIQANPELNWERDIRRKYGLSPDEYHSIRAIQNGACAACDRLPEPGQKLEVDHCHKSGQVRGLLCGPCNKALANVDDNVDRLYRLIGYLWHPRHPMVITSAPEL